MKQSIRTASVSRSGESGFTLIEMLIVAAILALVVSFALPSYMRARNTAAIDEATATALEWRALAWGCYLQTSNVSACASNVAIGFSEQPGRYWDWTSSSATYTVEGEQSGGNDNGQNNGKSNGNGNGVGDGQGNCGQDSGKGNNNGQDNGYGNGNGNGGSCGDGGTDSGATQLVVSWPSTNAGLENGETYSVTLYVSGSSQSQASVSCSPVSC